MAMRKPTNANLLDEAIYQKELAQKRLRYAENTIITDTILISELNEKIDNLRNEENIFKVCEDDIIRKIKNLISDYDEIQELKKQTYYSENDDCFECEFFKEAFE
jgi:hypothetical protein